MAPNPTPNRSPSEAAQDIDLELLGDTQAYLKCLSRNQAPDPPLHRAWERFYHIYAPLLKRFALTCRVSRTDLNDCLQEVWKELITALPDFHYDSGRGRFRSWLYTLVHSKAIDLIRSQARRRTQRLERQMEAVLHSPDADPVITYERQAQQEALQHALAALRPQVSLLSYRVLYLRWIEGRTVAETAAILGLTSRQVWFRHHRVKRKLHALFATGVRPALWGEV
jgi:RNA polymerase sigma-70 factor (ECF subfamily)